LDGISIPKWARAGPEQRNARIAAIIPILFIMTSCKVDFFRWKSRRGIAAGTPLPQEKYGGTAILSLLPAFAEGFGGLGKPLPQGRPFIAERVPPRANLVLMVSSRKQKSHEASGVSDAQPSWLGSSVDPICARWSAQGGRLQPAVFDSAPPQY
jgi:hypothetical protein